MVPAQFDATQRYMYERFHTKRFHTRFNIETAITRKRSGNFGNKMLLSPFKLTSHYFPCTTYMLFLLILVQVKSIYFNGSSINSVPMFLNIVCPGVHTLLQGWSDICITFSWLTQRNFNSRMVSIETQERCMFRKKGYENFGWKYWAMVWRRRQAWPQAAFFSSHPT